jgi:thiosulfate/3-mercaptopyruvate sulfurtransferase
MPAFAPAQALYASAGFTPCEPFGDYSASRNTVFMTKALLPPFVDAGWWAEHRDGVVTADVRWYLDGRSGAAAYADGHLPGAVFVDLDRLLAGAPGPDAGRHPLPDPETFAAGMAGLGIGDDDLVVAYDDAGGVIAARLVWMLRATGHDAAVLDGGLQAYEGPLDGAVPERPAARFTPRPWPAGRLASIDDAADPASVVIDARDRDRFRGEHEPVDPRAGHIPGARNVPCRENLDASGHLLPAPELRRRFEAAGATASAAVVSYCGSGVNACHSLLALEHAGFPAGRLYAGSWSQWSHSERPAATGDYQGP